jgi:hypothetical protein
VPEQHARHHQRQHLAGRHRRDVTVTSSPPAAVAVGTRTAKRSVRSVCKHATRPRPPAASRLTFYSSAVHPLCVITHAIARAASGGSVTPLMSR